MTDSRVSPQEFITGLLRANITDPNATARVAAGLSTNWIYPDRPLLAAMVDNENNFPRISVTRMDTSSLGDIGMGGTETEDSVTLLVNAYTIKTKPLIAVNTVTNESHTFASGTDDYSLDETPVTNITEVTGTLSSAAHTFVETTDYLLIDNDSDGRYDTIDWSPGGDDPDDTTDFYVDYVRKLEGDTLAEYLVGSVNVYLRDNWRSDTVPTLFDYQNIRISPILDEIGGRIKRCEMQIKLTGINISD
ncbi:DUF4815 domain-containing protein [Candidatus Calescamantes bacterium]|nr:DUF4815 domain-containing protein [Candidatus Calescamantes bacterium]